MVAKASVLHPTKENPSQQDKALKCGHISHLRPSDGRCAKCHYERNKRYRKTPNGHQLDLAHESRRRKRSNRIIYRMKWYVSKRIETKTALIAQLEEELLQYEQKDSNRAGES